MAGEARRRQVTLLEEVHVQTVPHALACEFQRWTVDRHVSTCGEVFSGDVSIRERRSYWCACRPKWMSLENLAIKNCRRQGVPTVIVAS